MTRFVGALIALTLLGGCTQNDMAKNYGGKMTINLPPCAKLVTATWKDSELWHLTRPFRADEKPETSVLHENSSFGVLQGTVTFIESCQK